MDIEGKKLPQHRRIDILWQDICFLFDHGISLVYSITGNKGRSLQHRNKRRTLAVSYFVLETVSFVFEQFENRVWGFTLVVFLLSAFVSTAVTYSYIKSRIAAKTKLQTERQFGVVEVVFSVLQLIATSISFVVRVLGIKIGYTVPCIFPLAFSIMVVFFVFKSEEDVSSHSSSEKPDRSSIDELQISGSTSVEFHASDTTATPVYPSLHINSVHDITNHVEVDPTEVMTSTHQDDKKLRHRYHPKILADLQPECSASQKKEEDAKFGFEQKVLIKVSMNDEKTRMKAMKLAANCSGVESVALKGGDKKQMEVIGEEVDVVELTTLLRNKIGYTDIISVGLIMDGVREKSRVILRTGSI